MAVTLDFEMWLLLHADELSELHEGEEAAGYDPDSDDFNDVELGLEFEMYLMNGGRVQ